MLQRADDIHADRRITSRQLAVQLSVSTGSAMAIIDTLEYSKVCARWVPRSPTTEHRRQRKAICSDLLERFGAEGEAFLSRIVTGDETWAHHYEPETKRQSMEWHHPQSPRKRKFKTTPSAGKVMITLFWDIDDVILVDVMARGKTINSDAYIKTFNKLKQRYRRVQPNRNPGDTLIQHNNARPHTNLRTQEAIAKFGWTVLPHRPYRPDLALSNFHLFGPRKDAPRGTRFEDDESMIHAVRTWLRETGNQLVQGRNACPCFALA
jgi:histone-lysine N-methyltransferase SETMAR